MQKFHFRSGGFDLLLEGYDDPVGILERVLEVSNEQDLEDLIGPAPTSGDTKKSGNQVSNVSIDSYMAERKPGSGRKMLEETARYLANVLEEDTFSKERLVEAASQSKHFRRDWRNQNSMNISRMVDAGFLVHFLDGNFRLGE